jgi:hypothetical protein
MQWIYMWFNIINLSPTKKIFENAYIFYVLSKIKGTCHFIGVITQVSQLKQNMKNVNVICIINNVNKQKTNKWINK